MPQDFSLFFNVVCFNISSKVLEFRNSCKTQKNSWSTEIHSPIEIGQNTTTTRANACVPYWNISRRWGNIDLWLLRAALSHRLPTGRPEVHRISRECAAALTTLLLLSTHALASIAPSPRHGGPKKMCDLVRAAPSILLQIKSWARERACVLFAFYLAARGVYAERWD